jgi:hypothetical protein
MTACMPIYLVFTRQTFEDIPGIYIYTRYNQIYLVDGIYQVYTGDIYLGNPKISGMF